LLVELASSREAFLAVTPRRVNPAENFALALVVATLAAFASGLDRDFRVPFFALVRFVAPDRADLSDAVGALLAFAAARPSAAIALQFLGALRSVGLLSICHDQRLRWFSLRRVRPWPLDDGSIRKLSPERCGSRNSDAAGRI
jgi:hypothetical protein